MLNLVLSNTRYGRFVLLASLCSLTACASRMPMPVEGMENFQPNCSQAEQQVAWLNSMRPTQGEIVASRFKAKLLGPADPEYQTHLDIAEHTTEWWIDTNLRQVYQKCARQL